MYTSPPLPVTLTNRPSHARPTDPHAPPTLLTALRPPALLTLMPWPCVRAPDALQVLETAMNLPGVRTAMSPQQRARFTRKVVEPSLHERATIYLMLADLLAKMSKMPDAPEAKKYVQDALREFEGTSEEVGAGRGRAGGSGGMGPRVPGGGSCGLCVGTPPLLASCMCTAPLDVRHCVRVAIDDCGLIPPPSSPGAGDGR